MKVLRIALLVMAALLIAGTCTSRPSPVSAAAEQSPIKLIWEQEHAAIGDSLRLSVIVDQADDVYAFDLKMAYSSAVIGFRSAASPAFSFAVSPVVDGQTIDFAATKVGKVAGESGRVVLCTLEFTVKSPGAVSTRLSSAKLIDSELHMTELPGGDAVAGPIVPPASSSSSEGSNIGSTSGPPDAGTYTPVPPSSDQKGASTKNEPLPGVSFRDIQVAPWAEPQIVFLAAKGIVQGVDEGRFTPQLPVTRADFVLLLSRCLSFNGSPGAQFADVPARSHYEETLLIARNRGIVEGDADNRFRPDSPVLREDMMVLAARALHAAGIELPKLASGRTTLDVFADRSEVSGYAVAFVSELLALGLIHGDETGLHPKNEATRAQAAVFLYNLYAAIQA